MLARVGVFERLSTATTRNDAAPADVAFERDRYLSLPADFQRGANLGIDLRYRALPQTRDSVLIALSGFGSDANIARSTETGFRLHLVKPVDPDLIIELLRDVGISR